MAVAIWPINPPIYAVSDARIEAGIVSTPVLDENEKRTAIIFSNHGVDPITVRAAATAILDRGVLVPPGGGPVTFDVSLHGPIPGRQWACISANPGNVLYVAEVIWTPPQPD